MKRKSKTIIAMRGRPLSPKRTEYGKQIRKAYEGGVYTGKESKYPKIRTEDGRYMQYPDYCSKRQSDFRKGGTNGEHFKNVKRRNLR